MLFSNFAIVVLYSAFVIFSRFISSFNILFNLTSYKVSTIVIVFVLKPVFFASIRFLMHLLNTSLHSLYFVDISLLLFK